MEGLHLFLQSSEISILNQMFPFLLIIIVMYLFFIRPQAKKQKEQLKFVEEMEKGQEVVTTSGIIGKITGQKDGIVTLEVGPKTYIRVTKQAISKEMTEETFK